MDVAGRELDQALVERSLGQVGRAHPGWLQQLVSFEEVAPLVGCEPGLQRRAAAIRRYRSVGLAASVLQDGSGPARFFR